MRFRTPWLGYESEWCVSLCARVCDYKFRDPVKVSCVCVGMRHLCVLYVCMCVCAVCVQSVCVVMLRECARVVGGVRPNVVRGVSHTIFSPRARLEKKVLSTAGLEPATSRIGKRALDRCTRRKLKFDNSQISIYIFTHKCHNPHTTSKPHPEPKNEWIRTLLTCTYRFSTMPDTVVEPYVG